MDSTEETETIKRYKSNPFSFCIKPLAVMVLLAAGYFCGPAIIYLMQFIIVWYDWFRFFMSNIFYVFLAVVALVGSIIYIQQHWEQRKIAEEKSDLYDQYVSAREYNYRVTEVEDDYNNSNSNNSSYKEIVAPAFQAVKEYNCCDRRAVMEEVSTKSYRRTRSERKMEKKGMRMMEYRRTESERVEKTASWRSETMDGLSSEEFRMTVETFITEKKKMLLWQSGGVDRWQNGGVDQWQNGVGQWQNNVPQLQNGVGQWQNNVPQLQNGVDHRQNDVVQWLNNVPQLQNGGFDQWQNNVPQLQNGGVDQWQNGVPQWQGSPQDGSGRHHRHQDRSQRLVGCSGPNGSGSYLAISN